MVKLVMIDKPLSSYQGDMRDITGYLFFVSVVDSAFIGKPREKSKTSQHQIKVGITDDLRRKWHLNEADIVKVLFERLREYVEEKVRDNVLLPKDELVLATDSEERYCPYDLARLPDPNNGCSFEVSVSDDLADLSLESLREQLRIHTKNLLRLQERQAHYGQVSPLDLLNEIDLEEKAIEEIQQRIQELGK